MMSSGEMAAAGSHWPDDVGMVYFGMSPWRAMWKSRHQLMSRFSAVMPVLYVEPWVGLRALRTGRVRRARVFTDMGARVDHYEPNVSVFRSKANLPVSHSPKLGSLTRKRWLRAVRQAIRAAGIERPIVWISKPEMHFILDELENAFSIYHVVDEYAGYTGVEGEQRDALASAEERALDLADLVIVASPELRDSKQTADRDVIVLENGVEPREYAEARSQASEPADLAGISRPRIGYSGLIGKRLDLDLVRAVAEHRPDCSVVLIGKIDPRECEAQLASLEAMPNVHLLGEKPAQEVASYVVGFDIGLLPYTINLETQHISPIKMYEYWAAGAPVLSTAIPAAQRHAFAVDVADDRDSFLARLDTLLQQLADRDSQRLIDLAAQNSWQSRVDTVGAELQARLGVG